MKLTLYRKYLLITISITVVFIVLGLIATFLATHVEREKFTSGPHLMFARLADRLATTQNVPVEQALALITSSEGEDFPMNLAIEDRATFAARNGLALSEMPQAAYEAKAVNGARFGPPPDIVVSLTSSPEKVLVAKFRPPPPRHGPPPFPLFARGPGGLTVNFLALVGSVVLASSVSLFLLFYSMREKAALTSGIIQRLKSGDLKARFPLTRMDEAGKIMMEFNKMADEIEALVERIRTSERGRMALLQELAHDLRTPVASLKNLLETLVGRKATLNEETRNELMELSLREIQYFERLIDDLLFLAQVAEPKLINRVQNGDAAIGQIVELKTLIEDELEAVETRYASTKKPLKVAFVVADGLPAVRGDHHLLRRLFRNAFENAFSFARSSIEVSVGPDAGEDGGVEIRVRDDGPGLDAESLAAFSQKRTTRKLEPHEGGRLSVGLGSVIMRAVAEAHGGQAIISNIVDETKQRTGAELRIRLAAGLAEGLASGLTSGLT